MKVPWTGVSVFLPLYDESQALAGVVEHALFVLKSMGLEKYELILVDDGSTDGTAEAADEFARQDDHVRVVHHPSNLGYGAALVSGFRAARYEIVVFTDGDGQFDLADIERFIEPSTRVDAVLGYRRRRNDHLGRRINAWGWGLLVRLVLGLKVRDLDCGFKLFRTERVQALQPLEARGAVISAELLLKLRNSGCEWEEVAVEHYPRKAGSASGARPGVIARAIRELIRLRQTQR